MWLRWSRRHLPALQKNLLPPAQKTQAVGLPKTPVDFCETTEQLTPKLRERKYLLFSFWVFFIIFRPCFSLVEAILILQQFLAAFPKLRKAIISFVVSRLDSHRTDFRDI
jgi:hypothetical protein